MVTQLFYIPSKLFKNVPNQHGLDASLRLFWLSATMSACLLLLLFGYQHEWSLVPPFPLLMGCIVVAAFVLATLLISQNQKRIFPIFFQGGLTLLVILLWLAQTSSAHIFIALITLLPAWFAITSGEKQLAALFLAIAWIGATIILATSGLNWIPFAALVPLLGFGYVWATDDGGQPAGLPQPSSNTHAAAIAELSHLLTTSSTQEIYRRSVLVFDEFLTADMYCITSWQPETKELREEVRLQPTRSKNKVNAPKISESPIPIDLWPGTHLLLQESQSRIIYLTDQSLSEIERNALADTGFASLLEAPLSMSDGNLGTIRLFRHSDQPPFQQSESELLVAMAGQIAFALHNASITMTARARAAQLNTLNRFSQILSQTGSLRQMFIDARREILPLFEATGISIALTAPDSNLLEWVYSYAYGTEILPEGIPPAYALHQYAEQVVETQTPLLIHNDSSTESENPLEDGAWLGVPLVVAKRIIGVLTIQNGDDEAAFDERDQRLLTTVAGPLAISVNNLQQLEQVESALELQSNQSLLLRTAAEVSAASASILNVEELSKRVVDLIQERFDFPYVALFFLDEASDYALLQAGSGTADWEEPAGIRLRVGDPTTIGQAMATGQIQISNDDNHIPPELADHVPADAHAILAIPLRSRGSLSGAIAVFSQQAVNFTDQASTVLQTLADQVSSAIENARLFAQVQDSLIRINNLFLASRQIIHAEHTQTVYETLTDFAHASGRVDIAHLIVPDPKSPDRFDFPAFWSAEDTAYSPSYSYPLETLPFSEILPRNELLTVADGQTASEFSSATQALFVRSNMHATAFIPIHRDQEWLGTLALIRKTKRPFGREETQPFLTLCNQAAVALANQQLLNETNTLYRSSRSLSQVITREDALAITIQELASHMAADQCRVVFYDHRLGFGHIELEHTPSGQMTNITMPMKGDPVFEEMRRQRQPILLRQRDTDDAVASTYLKPFDAAISLLIPALSQQELIGFIAIDSQLETREFTATQINFAQTLVDQLSTQIENLALFDEALTRAQEMITLNQIGTLISGTLDIDDLAQIIHEQVGRLLDNSIFLLAQYDVVSGIYRPLLCTRYGERFIALSRQLSEEDILYKLLHHNRVPTQNEQAMLSQQAGLEELFVTGWTPESSLWLPMQQDGEPTGLISVQSYSPHAYNENHLQLLRTIANQAGLALANAQLFRQTENTLAELRSLFDITQAAAISPNPTQRLEKIVQTLNKHFESALVSVLTVDEETQQLYEFAGAAETQQRGAFDSPHISMINNTILNGQPALLNDLRLLPSFAPEQLARSQIIIPLTFGQRTIGIINVESPSINAFTQSDLRLLQTLGVSVAATIESDRLFRDIRDANEQLMVLDRLKMQFLANMSHELRTPLNSIIGFSRIILKGIDGPINDQQEEDLTAIYNSGQHLLHIINDILDVARIEAGKLALVFERVDFGNISERVLATIRGLVRDKSITLSAYIEPNLPLVEADPVRVRQILLNLLSNAAKFTEKGTIELHIAHLEAYQQADDNHPQPYIQIVVRDTGLGIAPEHYDKIFTAFEQIDASSTRTHEGTGLGLPITKRLVTMHRGSIEVESAIGHGTAFTLYLPVRQPAGTPINDHAFGTGTPNPFEPHG